MCNVCSGRNRRVPLRARWPVKRVLRDRSDLSHDRSRDHRLCLNSNGVRVRNSSRGHGSLTVDSSNDRDLSLGALAADVSGLTASVAGLASRIERTAVRGLAVTRDVAKFSAGVAFHGLSLAVTCKVVRATALVAAGTGTTLEATTEAAEAASCGHASATADWRSNASGTRGRAVPLLISQLLGFK